MMKILLVILVAGCLADCGGSSGPTSPSPTPAISTSSDPRVVSCSGVTYRGATETFQCSIPGQSQQPSAIHKFFPGRTDCLIASCTAGCVSAVRLGTNSGGVCR